MGKRSQISLFVVIGICVALLLLLFFSLNNSRQLLNSDSTIFASDVNIIKEYVDSCLEQSVLESVAEYGLIDSEEKLDQNIPLKLQACTDGFKNFYDYKITADLPTAKTVIEDMLVEVDVIYPILVERSGARFELKDFHYYLDRAKFLKIEDGVLSGGTNLVSTDGSARISVVSKTDAHDKETGQPIE